jgi:hypothetical protein
MSVLAERLSDFDPETADLIGKELERQRNGLEMIASANRAPLAHRRGARGIEREDLSVDPLTVAGRGVDLTDQVASGVWAASPSTLCRSGFICCSC